MRVFWTAAAALLTVGCGTMPVPSSSATPVPAQRIHAPDFTKPDPGSAYIVVTRDTGWQAKRCPAQVFIDGTLVADLQAGEQVRLFVPNGEHLIGVTVKGGFCITGSDQIAVEATPSKPHLLRIATKVGDPIKIQQSAF